MPDIDTIERSLQNTQIWLRDIMREFKDDNRQRALHALRAVLAAIRDRIPVSEAAQFSAQLPIFVRGLFWEGWDPDRPSRAHNRADFLDLIHSHLAPVPEMDAEDCFRAVMRTLWRHVSAGELRDVRSVMPLEVQQMMDAMSPAPVG